MKETLKLIGNTPLYRIENTNIYVKLEKFNAAGSIKDRAVLGMLKKAMEKGTIKKDSVLIEATSGNTGIALAMLGAIYHLPVIKMCIRDRSSSYLFRATLCFATAGFK